MLQYSTKCMVYVLVAYMMYVALVLWHTVYCHVIYTPYSILNIYRLLLTLRTVLKIVPGPLLLNLALLITVVEEVVVEVV